MTPLGIDARCHRGCRYFYPGPFLRANIAPQGERGTRRRYRGFLCPRDIPFLATLQMVRALRHSRVPFARSVTLHECDTAAATTPCVSARFCAIANRGRHGDWPKRQFGRLRGRKWSKTNVRRPVSLQRARPPFDRGRRKQRHEAKPRACLRSSPCRGFLRLVVAMEPLGCLCVVHFSLEISFLACCPNHYFLETTLKCVTAENYSFRVGCLAQV